MNTELLKRALRFIEAHPDNWNQSKFFTDPITHDVPRDHVPMACGVKMCLGGVVVYLANKSQTYWTGGRHWHDLGENYHSATSHEAAKSLGRYDADYQRIDNIAFKLFFDYPDNWQEMGPERFAEWVWSIVN